MLGRVTVFTSLATTRVLSAGSRCHVTTKRTVVAWKSTIKFDNKLPSINRLAKSSSLLYTCSNLLTVNVIDLNTVPPGTGE